MVEHQRRVNYMENGTASMNFSYLIIGNENPDSWPEPSGIRKIPQHGWAGEFKNQFRAARGYGVLLVRGKTGIKVSLGDNIALNSNNLLPGWAIPSKAFRDADLIDHYRIFDVKKPPLRDTSMEAFFRDKVLTISRPILLTCCCRSEQ